MRQRQPGLGVLLALTLSLVPASLSVPTAVQAQPAPTGPSFLVQPNVRGWHGDPAIAATSDGRFVAAWRVHREGGPRIFARLFEADGRPAGPARRLVVPLGDDFPTEAAVTVGAGNTWILAWGNAGQGLFVERFTPDGMPFAPRRRIAAGEFSSLGPQICSDVTGAFVVAWSASDRLALRRFDAQASPLGAVVTVADDVRSDPALACRPDGGFALAWIDLEGRCQVLDHGPDGEPKGPVREAGPEPVRFAVPPRLAATAAGELAVAWDEPLRLQFFDAAGRSPRPPRLAGADSTGGLGAFDVVTDDNRSFTVIWAGRADDGLDVDSVDLFPAPVFLRRFTAGGQPDGPLRHLTTIWGLPWKLRAAAWDDALALLWSGPSDGDQPGLFAQAFDGGAPGAFQFTRARTAVREDAGGVDVVVERVGGSGGEATVTVLAVPQILVPGVGQPGQDYRWLRRQLRFADGDSQPRALRLELVDDSRPEIQERVALRLLKPTGGTTLGPRDRTAVEIFDDDRPSTLGARGAAIAVSDGELPSNARPAVAMASDGTWTVAWEASGQRGGGFWHGVLARRFDAGDKPLERPVAFPEAELPALCLHPGRHPDDGVTLLFQQNTYIDLTFGDDEIPTAKHGYGHAEVTLCHAAPGADWTSPVLVHAGPDIFHGPSLGRVTLARTPEGNALIWGALDGTSALSAQVIDAAGRPVGSVRRIADSGTDAAVGLQPTGEALGLWGLDYDGSGPGIVGTTVGLDDGGVLIGPEAPWSPQGDVRGAQLRAAVTPLAGGRFLAVWQSLDTASGAWRLVGRFLSSRGVPLGDELVVSADAHRHALEPSVAAFRDGAVVVWLSRAVRGPNDDTQIRLQEIDGVGWAIGAPRIVAAAKGLFGLGRPAVATSSADDAVVVYEASGRILARHLETISTESLAGKTVAAETAAPESTP